MQPTRGMECLQTRTALDQPRRWSAQVGEKALSLQWLLPHAADVGLLHCGVTVLLGIQAASLSSDRRDIWPRQDEPRAELE